VAAGQNLTRGGVAWHARRRARGEELERRLASRRRRGATRVENGTGGVAATVSSGGDSKQLLVARAAAWRARGGPAGGVKAVGELRGDAWSGAGAVFGLGQRGNYSRRRRYRTAEEAEEEEERGGGQGLICCFQKFQGPYCKPTFPTNLKFK
jgi:hypothetical protein